MKDNLGNRMKEYYENTYRLRLTRRTPVILRIDGRAFHTFTKGFDRPYDMPFQIAMWKTAKYLCENIQGAKFAYEQSDEISILLIDYDKLTTSAWFDNNIQKMVSVASSMATMAFNQAFFSETLQAYKKGFCDEEKYERYQNKFFTATFDARVFNIPESEVCNYFIWRQIDATKNSISTLGRVYFSDRELHGLNRNQVQDLLMTKKINWNNSPTFFKRGICVEKKPNDEKFVWEIDREIPIFSQNQQYVEKHLAVAD